MVLHQLARMTAAAVLSAICMPALAQQAEDVPAEEPPYQPVIRYDEAGNPIDPCRMRNTSHGSTASRFVFIEQSVARPRGSTGFLVISATTKRPAIPTAVSLSAVSMTVATTWIPTCACAPSMPSLRRVSVHQYLSVRAKMMLLSKSAVTTAANVPSRRWRATKTHHCLPALALLGGKTLSVVSACASASSSARRLNHLFRRATATAGGLVSLCCCACGRCCTGKKTRA